MAVIPFFKKYLTFRENTCCFGVPRGNFAQLCCAAREVGRVHEPRRDLVRHRQQAMLILHGAVISLRRESPTHPCQAPACAHVSLMLLCSCAGAVLPTFAFVACICMFPYRSPHLPVPLAVSGPSSRLLPCSCLAWLDSQAPSFAALQLGLFFLLSLAVASCRLAGGILGLCVVACLCV